MRAGQGLHVAVAEMREAATTAALQMKISLSGLPMRPGVFSVPVLTARWPSVMVAMRP